MSKKNDTYPHYHEGMTLPTGVFPPIDRYTNRDMVNIFMYKTYQFLLDSQVDAVIAKRDMHKISEAIMDILQNNQVEYALSSVFNAHHMSVFEKIKKIESCAEDVSELAYLSTVRILKTLHPKEADQDFIVQIAQTVPRPIKEHICSLIHFVKSKTK